MNVLIYILTSALLAAISNLWVRKSIDTMQTQGDPFAVQRLIATGIFITIAGLATTGTYAFDIPVIAVGIFSGIFLGLLMWAGARAVSTGPAGLTIAIVNSACIMPPLIMALLFGSKFGHTFTLTNGIGNFLVLVGLFFASRTRDKSVADTTWFIWIGIAFIVHTILLTSLQWRALLLNPALPASVLLPFKISQASANSFGLVMAATAACILFVLPVKNKIAKTSWRTIAWYGIAGGAINGIANFFTLRATEIATIQWEKAILFPLYCVLLIAFCSIWAKVLYKETIAWGALLLCAIGIILSLL